MNELFFYLLKKILHGIVKKGVIGNFLFTTNLHFIFHTTLRFRIQSEMRKHIHHF